MATLKHTSFASPLDSILFRDSTHSSHFAQPLGTSGTSIPPFTSRSTDTDVPTSAALPPPPLSLSLPFLLRFSCFPSLTARTDSASFPARRFPLSLDPRASFVRSFVRRFQPSSASTPPAWSRSYIQYCRYVPSFVSRIVNTRLPTRRFAQVRACRQVKAAATFPREIGEYSLVEGGIARCRAEIV